MRFWVLGSGARGCWRDPSIVPGAFGQCGAARSVPVGSIACEEAGIVRHGGAGDSRSRCMAARMRWNRSRGIATSASWKMIVRAWRTTRASKRLAACWVACCDALVASGYFVLNCNISVARGHRARLGANRAALGCCDLSTRARPSRGGASRHFDRICQAVDAYSDLMPSSRMMRP